MHSDCLGSCSRDGEAREPGAYLGGPRQGAEAPAGVGRTGESRSPPRQVTQRTHVLHLCVRTRHSTGPGEPPPWSGQVWVGSRRRHAQLGGEGTPNSAEATTPASSCHCRTPSLQGSGGTWPQLTGACQLTSAIPKGTAPPTACWGLEGHFRIAWGDRGLQRPTRSPRKTGEQRPPQALPSP